ncbi:HAD hydrolase-like protein [Peribacillus frigoritolerans]|uniref:HAD hydrolase-like protein n=1 Tax=Peribacillus frigoritolerans TaxID=450367 RepID=UPI002E23730C|nr:HAD hydrolase-like protein [Peribacillus frigoritolerans]MED3845748.1 HAD hydrolase-like protein [Peribacillus frigoritolerans]
MSKVILFNFNGTIVNTKSLAIDIFNEIAERRGYKKINNKDIHYLSTLSIRDRCKRLDVPIYQMPWVGLQIKQRYQQYIPNLKSVDGINEVIYELKQKGFRLGFLTTNSRVVTTQFLTNNSINVFDYTHYSFNPFSKAKDISSFLKSNGLYPNEVIYLGDELRDIKASKKNRLCFIATSWGYDSIELLNEGQADYIAQQPKDILNIVSRL